MTTLITIITLFAIDSFGYIVRCLISPNFAKFEGRRYPFMWAFYTSK